MDQNLVYLGDTHVLGMAEVVKEDVTFDPARVDLFDAVGIMLETNGIRTLVEEILGCMEAATSGFPQRNRLLRGHCPRTGAVARLTRHYPLQVHRT